MAAKPRGPRWALRGTANPRGESFAGEDEAPDGGTQRCSRRRALKASGEFSLASS